MLKMLTILAGEPLASIVIVLRVSLDVWMTNCQCCVVDCEVSSRAGPQRRRLPHSLSLYFKQREKAGKSLSMTTPAHDKEFPKNFQELRKSVIM